MRRTAIRSFFLLGALAGAAQAQYLTDAGSPLGAGGGGGSVAPFVPRSPGAIVSRGLSGGAAGSAARTALLAALGGNPAAFVAALGGSPQATELGAALANLGPLPTPQSLLRAIVAYNALLDLGTPASPTARVTAKEAERLLVALGAQRVKP